MEPVINEITIRPELPPLATKEQRKANWRRIALYVNSLGDRLGMPIDEGIKETVTAMSVIGINTTQSCEGHLDRALGYPWIDIAAPTTESSQERVYELESVEKKGQKLKDAGVASEKIMQLFGERYFLLLEEQRSHNQQEVNKIRALLDVFYTGSSVPPGRRLQIEYFYDDSGRMQTGEAAIQNDADYETRAKNLPIYQKEMKSFTSFLKNIYFGE